MSQLSLIRISPLKQIISKLITTFSTTLFSIFLVTFSLASYADQYPDMIGIWKGHIRVVSSGAAVADQVARGGAVLSEVDAIVNIDFQEGESFIGKSRAAQTPKTQPSTAVWGALRSNGKEASFVTSDGGRGQLWMQSENSFEYCITNLQESVFTAYCGILKKD